MAVKFLLDSAQKNEEALVNEILETIKQKPSINDSTVKLATFIDVVFRTAARRSQLKQVIENVTPQVKQAPRIFKPVPIELEKKEYLIKLFETPVGILLEKEDKSDKYTYKVMEPNPEIKIINLVKKLIKQDVQINHKVIEDKRYMQGQTEKACRQLKAKCDSDVVRRVVYYVKRDFLGFRRIDPFMHDANVREIHCEGINKPVKIKYKHLPEKIETNVVFKNPKDLDLLIRRIAGYVGIKVSATTPVVDVTINGFKIHATAGVSGVSSKLLITKLE